MDSRKDAEPKKARAASTIWKLALFFILAAAALTGVLYGLGGLHALGPVAFVLLALLYWPIIIHYSYEKKIHALEDKIEEIGKLTSRLRHDLGTPVMVISSLSQLMQKLEEAGNLSREDIKKNLARIEDNSAKAVELTQRFQYESRELIPPAQALDKT